MDRAWGMLLAAVQAGMASPPAPSPPCGEGGVRPALDIVIANCRKIGVEVLAGARMNDCFGIAPLLPATPDRSRF